MFSWRFRDELGRDTSHWGGHSPTDHVGSLGHFGPSLDDNQSTDLCGVFVGSLRALISARGAHIRRGDGGVDLQPAGGRFEAV